VGRVQSPTLGLIVQRELEAPGPCGRALLGGECQVRPIRTAASSRSTRRTSFWDEKEAKTAVANSKTPGTVKEISGEGRIHSPSRPTPAQHDRLHHRTHPAASAITSVASDEDRRGPLTWTATSPIRRTDNNVYPISLNTKELVSGPGQDRRFQGGPEFLLDGARPGGDPGQEGERPTTRRSIRPRPSTPNRPRGAPAKRIAASTSSSGAPPFPGHLLPADDLGVHPGEHRNREGHGVCRGLGETYFRFRGSVVIDPGYAAIYNPTARSADNRDSEVGGGPGARPRGDVELEGKETRPPRPGSARGKLIELMEERGPGHQGDPAPTSSRSSMTAATSSPNPPEALRDLGSRCPRPFENYVPADGDGPT